MIGHLWKYVRKLTTLSTNGRSIERRRRGSAATPPRFESLEDRRLLAVSHFTFDAATSRVVVIGTAGADNVLVSSIVPGQLQFRFESVEGVELASFSSSSVSSITFYGGDGDDRFQNATATASRAYGDNGNDWLLGGTGIDEFYGGEGADRLFGWSGDDVLNGNAGDDVILGQFGNDTLIGEGGNDVLGGAEGDDILYAGDGSDQLWGGTGNDRLYGHEGDDSLYGDAGDDLLHGALGDDLLDGGAGNDSLEGGDGHDILWGQAGVDSLFGDSGNDELHGNEGDDRLYGGDGNDVLLAGSGNDQLWGHAGDDLMWGEDGHDELYGGDGSDRLRGNYGNDRLEGEAGDDKMWGQEGDDSLIGDLGNDELHGDAGDDRLFGGDGNDVLLAGAGSDQLWGNTGNDLMWGEDGNDELYGGDGSDQLRGNYGNDRLEGEVGDDKMWGQEGDDVLVGGLGNDEAYGGDESDRLYGDDGHDTLFGDAGNDFLFGMIGNDALVGGDGDDEIYGSEGNDYLYGGAGVDWLNGELGDDQLWGQAGNDTLIGEAGSDLLYGGDADDRLYGGDGNDMLLAGAGNDQLLGQAGNDLMWGEQGNDEIYGGDGNDELRGGDGNDALQGGTGDDMMWGQAGDDSLLGESGNDVMLGGDGRDIFDGGGGSDLLIGGNGQDDLNGNIDDDILIGGTTVYDNDTAALQLIMAQWTSASPYAAKILAIENDLFAARLESSETVIDDQVADKLTGAGGDDWFFLTGVMPTYNPVPHDSGLEPEGHHSDAGIVDELPELEGFDLIDSLDNLSDVQTTEAIHTKIPHGTDALKQREHLALFELVRYDEVTHFAIQDGAWSNPATWSNGIVPTNGSRVLIPIGVEVVVNASIPARMTTIRVDGTLAFSTTANSTLRVDTIVVSGTGTFEMGTATQPIAPHVTARLIITNDGPINRVRDPFGISRGLISHGHVSIYGAERTSHLPVIGSVPAGATQIRFTAAPVGWRVGDSIVLTSSVNGTEQNEVRTIQSISGTTVTFSQPLLYSHMSPSSGLQLHAANLTRNAMIESEATTTDRRGHVMFMHHREVDINYAGFYRLGRTDKLTPINDPVIDANWNLAAGTGTNPRGRYAVHFHRNGSVDDGNPAVVRGSVVSDGASWGFVNHSSYVDISDNVAFDATGAGFVTEAGDEIGNFTRNIAIGTVGSGEVTESRQYIQDFGHQGDGFWFQGPGISVTNNVSAGNDGSAFFFYSRGLFEGGQQRQFLSQNLPQPAIAGGAAMIDVNLVPIFQFQQNTGYSSGVGLTVQYHLRDATHGQLGVFEDSLLWNNTTGVALPYTQNTILQNLVIFHTLGTFPFEGVSSNGVTRDNQYNNLVVIGYHRGIELPLGGTNVVNGGYFDNRYNFVVGTANSPGRSIRINGPISFGTTAGVGQFQVLMQIDFAQFPGRSDYIFLEDSVTLNYGPFINQQVFFTVQAPTAIPFPVALPDVSLAYVGLTSQQLWNAFRLAVAGEVAPSNTFTVPNIIGLIAPI